MEVRLLVAHSKSEKKQIRLGAETVIGRSPECNLRIASGQVSRRHCLIKIEQTTVLVRDLGSVNGTRLNGQTIDSELDVPVPPGSTLVVGPLKFVVQFAPPRPAGSRGGSTEQIPQTARDFEEMATVPVFDGEETKDYPPTRERKRELPPPVEIAGERRDPGDDAAESAPAHTTEADIASLADDTVFDVSLDAGAPAGSEAPRAPVGSETDLVFEEDDLKRLAAIMDDAGEGGEAAAATGTDDAAADSEQPRDGGWHLLDMLRRKKKPGAPRAADGPDDSTPDELRKFLDDA